MTTDLESGNAAEADALFDALRAKAKRNMIVGGLWCLGGTLVTVLTYASAQEGGSYTIAWGAIIFGGIQFLRGLADMQRLEQARPATTTPAAPTTPTVPAVKPPDAAPKSVAMTPSSLSVDPSTPIEPRASVAWVWWGIALVLTVFFIYLALQIRSGKLPW